jgi:ABC-type polysaccharide/polyol phosphate export permease
MIVAAIAVFFYDVLDLTRVIVQLIYYLTPTFYPITIFSDNLLRLVKANPMFSYVDIFRDFMYRGVFPRPWQWLMMFGTAIVFLVVGVWVFGRSRKQLVSTL